MSEQDWFWAEAKAKEKVSWIWHNFPHLYLGDTFNFRPLFKSESGTKLGGKMVALGAEISP